VAEGGHAVLSKPFSLDELGRVIREVLDHAEPPSRRAPASAGA
jgi:hypothetical protein